MSAPTAAKAPVASGSEHDESKHSTVAYDARLVRRLWSFVRPHQRWVWTSFVLLLVTSACQLAAPWLVKVAIDSHLVTGDLTGFGGLCVAFGLVSLVEILARGWQTWTLDVAGENALLDLRLAVFRHLQRLSSRFYDRTPIGRLIGRVTTDIEALQELFSSGVVTILGDFVFLFATLGILFAFDFELTLVTLVLVPLLLGLTMFIRSRVRVKYIEMVARRSRLNAYLHEHVVGMPLVQAFGRQRIAKDGFEQASRGMRDAQLGSVWWESWLSALTEMVGSFAIALILWYGGRLVLGVPQDGDERLTLGALFLFIEYMQRFFAPLNDLSLKYTVMQNAMTASDRIFELLDEDDVTLEPVGAVRVEHPRGRVSFRNVTFGYAPEDPVLRDVSFEVAPGEHVAIVGATGSGKTTILKLLTRLYDVQEGSVEVDDIDVRELSLASLRRHVGIVPQDVFLFGGTVLDNVRLGRPDLTEAQAIAIADELHLDEVVARFPRGYHEPLRERGSNLSSGERQLIAFARVMALEPVVLALDEATANVDTHTERLLQDALSKLLAGRTALVIAHRLSTIRDADRILVIHQGRLVEEGTHDELLASRGAYWRLVQLELREGAAAASELTDS